MNAPFAVDTALGSAAIVREADLRRPEEAARIERFVREAGGTVFHRPTWLMAIERGTGQAATGLVIERGGNIAGWLPLTCVHSPVFGRALVSSGFAVDGGILAPRTGDAAWLAEAAQEMAQRRACAEVELRGGPVPAGWHAQEDSHVGFVRPLAEDDEAELLAIPRKHRAEVRKGLKNDLEVSVGSHEADRAAHHAVYAQSVHNLGTPVFPRSLFDAVLDAFDEDADILTVRHQGEAVASVLSLYHDGAVLPFWGGGLRAARNLRANELMYFRLMGHARARGCNRFDFGRSKTGSGPAHYKKNWGFEAEPLIYARWHAPGSAPRDVDPTSDTLASRIALWKKLPHGVANRLGPWIARGLG